MRFKNLLKYNPTFLTKALITGSVICIGVGGYVIHKVSREMDDSIDSTTVSSMADSTINISDSVGRLYNQRSFQDSIVMSKFDSVIYYLGDIHESLHRMLGKLDSVNTSLDSVASLP